MKLPLFSRTISHLCLVALFVLAAACSDPDGGSNNDQNNGADAGGVDTVSDDTATDDTESGDTESGDTETQDTGNDNDTRDDAGPSCTPDNCQSVGANSIAECVSDTCEYRCEDGYVDLNGDYEGTDTPDSDSDDCELECTPSNGGEEICDGQDNDCDGQTDEDDAVDAGTWYEDSDGDGYGDSSSTTAACDQPSGYVDNDTDCDDTDASTYEELTGYKDADGDSYTAGGAETLCTGGSLPSGYLSSQSNEQDCDDSDDAVYPDAPGLCDGKDNDCNGTADDIRAISSASHTFTPDANNGVNDSNLDNNDPGLTGMLSTPTEDGFCTVQYDPDRSEFVFSLIDTATGNVQTAKHSTTGTNRERRLLDIAWDSPNCVALYHYKSLGTNALYAIRWEPGSGIVAKIITDSGLPPITTTKKWAALDSVCLESPTCFPQWVIAHQSTGNNPNGSYQLWYRGMALDLGTSRQSGIISFDIGFSLEDIDIGPSGVPGDEAAIVYYDGNDSAWNVVSTGKDRDWTLHNGARLSNNDLGMPVLGTLEGRQDAFYSFKNTASNDFELNRLAGPGWYGVTTYTSAPEPSFVSKDILAKGPKYEGWVLDSYGTTDTIWPFNIAGGGSPIRPAGASPIYAEDIASTIQEQILAIRSAGPDHLESITAYSADPLIYKTHRYTCY